MYSHMEFKSRGWSVQALHDVHLLGRGELGSLRNYEEDPRLQTGPTKPHDQVPRNCTTGKGYIISPVGTYYETFPAQVAVALLKLKRLG